MSENQKKIFPKFKKQLQGFLTDESGKVTKTDVLKLGIGAMMVGGVAGDASAATHGNGCNTSSNTNTVSFGTPVGTQTYVNNSLAAAGNCGSPGPGHLNGFVYTKPGIAPYSVVVNGHANGNANIQGAGFNGGTLTTVSTHGSHGNHSSHGSHGQW